MSTELAVIEDTSTEIEQTEDDFEPRGKGLAKLDIKARQMEAWELRHLKRLPWDKVAELTGYKNAKTAMQGAATYAKRNELEPIEDYRRMQIDKAEAMLRALERKADAGDERAIDTSLRVMQYLDHHLGIGEQTNQHVDVDHKITITTTMGEDDFVKRMSAVAPPMEKGPSVDVPDGMIPNPWVEDAIVDAEVVED
jgi:hypothetical protein